MTNASPALTLDQLLEATIADVLVERTHLSSDAIDDLVPRLVVAVLAAHIDAKLTAAPSDLSKRLREYANHKPEYAVRSVATRDLLAAADEIERYCGGMMAWKRTAEAKDADLADSRAYIASLRDANVQLASQSKAAPSLPADLIADFRDAIAIARHRAEHAGDTKRKNRWVEVAKQLDAALAAKEQTNAPTEQQVEAQAPGGDWYDARDGVEHSHPEYGQGVFFTPDCARAPVAAGQQAEPVAEVTDRYSRDGYNDEISVLLPVGTKLYAPPVDASQASAPKASEAPVAEVIEENVIGTGIMARAVRFIGSAARPGDKLYLASPAATEANGAAVPDGWPTPDMRAAGLAEAKRRDCDADSSDVEMIFEAMIAAAPAAPEGAKLTDAERLDWLDQNIFHREMDDWDTKTAPNSVMWVTFAPKGAQGTARRIIDAAIEREKQSDTAPVAATSQPGGANA